MSKIWVFGIIIVVLCYSVFAEYANDTYGSGCYGVENCPSSEISGPNVGSGSGGSGGGIQIIKTWNNTNITKKNTTNITNTSEKIIKETTSRNEKKPIDVPEEPDANSYMNYTEKVPELIIEDKISGFPWWLIVVLILIIIFILVTKDRKEK